LGGFGAGLGSALGGGLGSGFGSGFGFGGVGAALGDGTDRTKSTWTTFSALFCQ
jgi:hypothetical protein